MITIRLDMRTYVTLMAALRECEPSDEQFARARLILQRSVHREILRQLEFDEAELPAILKRQA